MESGDNDIGLNEIPAHRKVNDGLFTFHLTIAFFVCKGCHYQMKMSQLIEFLNGSHYLSILLCPACVQVNSGVTKVLTKASPITEFT